MFVHLQRSPILGPSRFECSCGEGGAWAGFSLRIPVKKAFELPDVDLGGCGSMWFHLRNLCAIRSKMAMQILLIWRCSMHYDRGVSTGAPIQSGGWLAGIQEGARRENGNRIDAILNAPCTRMLEIRSWRLPEGARVEAIGIDPRLYELIYESLPEGLKNRGNRDLLEHELTECQLAENGRKIVGGEHVVNLKGQSRNWNYRGRFKVSIFARSGLAESSASMSQLRKTHNALASHENRTSGPTINVEESTGLAARPNASDSVGYKMERESGRSRNFGSGRASTLAFDSGYTYFSTPAELRFEVDWGKRNRALAGWARGQSHKRIVMSGFSMIPMVYGVPTALAHTMWPVRLGPSRARLPRRWDLRLIAAARPPGADRTSRSRRHR